MPPVTPPVTLAQTVCLLFKSSLIMRPPPLGYMFKIQNKHIIHIKHFFESHSFTLSGDGGFYKLINKLDSPLD